PIWPLTRVASIASTSAQFPDGVGVPRPSPISLASSEDPRRSAVNVTSTAPWRSTVKLCELTPSRATVPANVSDSLPFDPLDSVVTATNAPSSKPAARAIRLAESMTVSFKTISSVAHRAGVIPGEILVVMVLVGRRFIFGNRFRFCGGCDRRRLYPDAFHDRTPAE